MAAYDLPDDFLPASARIWLEEAVLGATSPLTGDSQVRSLASHKWRMTIDYPPMRHEDAAPREAFWNKVGSSNTVRVWHPRWPDPRGTMRGSPKLNAAASKGATTIQILCPPNPQFGPSDLGAWYDPSDLSTLFQDSAGTTPVTALGQPVGLILDKRKGLVRGPELVTDGGFDSETVWWAVVNGTAVINSGALVCTDTGGIITLYKNGVTTAGKWYEINLDLVSASGHLTAYVGGALVSFGSTPGRKRAIALATGTQVAFQIGGGVGATFTIDNISVRELPGNHAYQTTSTARPVLAAGGALDYDGVDDKLTTTFPDLGTNVAIVRSIPGVGASALTGQTIGAGAWDDATDHAGLVIINRALTVAEISPTLRVGDCIGIGDQMVQVMADATANGSGVLTVSILPKLRKAYALNTPIVWDRARVEMRVMSSIEHPYAPGYAPGITVDLREK